MDQNERGIYPSPLSSPGTTLSELWPKLAVSEFVRV